MALQGSLQNVQDHLAFYSHLSQGEYEIKEGGFALRRKEEGEDSVPGDPDAQYIDGFSLWFLTPSHPLYSAVVRYCCSRKMHWKVAIERLTKALKAEKEAEKKEEARAKVDNMLIIKNQHKIKRALGGG